LAKKVVMVRKNVLRIASMIALYVAAGCVLTVVFAYLVLLVSFRKLCAGLTKPLLPREARIFILIKQTSRSRSGFAAGCLCGTVESLGPCVLIPTA
jgi:hypothetical protein